LSDVVYIFAEQLHTSGKVLDTTLHYQLVSTKQFSSHPSPFTRLPSSHPSLPFRFPSPQVDTQISSAKWVGFVLEKAGSSVQVNPSSNVHVEEHPSLSLLFPSSHSFEANLIPSPQLVQTFGVAVLQVKEASTVRQSELHPSPLAVLPSSQTSAPVS